MTLRQYYWNPRTGEQPFVSEQHFLYAFNKRQAAGTWSDLHIHTDWGELAYVVSGSIVVCSSSGNYLGQSSRAIWIPVGLQHEWYLPESSSNRSLFIHSSVFALVPRFLQYQALEITPLLRELILAMSNYPLDRNDVIDNRLVQVLLDWLIRSKAAGSPLLMPREHRLVELCGALLSEPDKPVSLENWSHQLGMSEKTLARLFVRQTGQTFGRWLQSVRMQHALQEIETGESVTTVAMNCGYNSVSAFIATFKKHFGKTPGIYRKRQESEEG